jgi:hypothetical protein
MEDDLEDSTKIIEVVEKQITDIIAEETSNPIQVREVSTEEETTLIQINEPPKEEEKQDEIILQDIDNETSNSSVCLECGERIINGFEIPISYSEMKVISVYEIGDTRNISKKDIFCQREIEELKKENKKEEDYVIGSFRYDKKFCSPECRLSFMGKNFMKYRESFDLLKKMDRIGVIGH